jgi:hypothetical protein
MEERSGVSAAYARLKFVRYALPCGVSRIFAG